MPHKNSVLLITVLLVLATPTLVNVQCPACGGTGHISGAQGIQILNVSAAVALCSIPATENVNVIPGQKVLPVIGKQELNWHTPDECGSFIPLEVTVSVANPASIPLKGVFEVTAKNPVGVYNVKVPVELGANTTQTLHVMVPVGDERVDYEITVTPVGFEEITCPYCDGKGNISIVDSLYFLLRRS
jgi:hypothetical protein